MASFEDCIDFTMHEDRSGAISLITFCPVVMQYGATALDYKNHTRQTLNLLIMGAALKIVRSMAPCVRWPRRDEVRIG